jgi:hypothetical protein
LSQTAAFYGSAELALFPCPKHISPLSVLCYHERFPLSF